ncbi:hypothetical protein BC936DRAFT_147274 [Jimgerdemannia flammicorona]|uniref:Uncharacterized protein n=2 Tax=Jimgerdemannia flammicorona TaxID=994334 RepID=A0A433D5R9_9FUNG|nr:hypothetical protein BC936DRAFT_147274 [Jimgerdemannia flammicorona]RUS28145.1 hypothetical protein BC938DRAFT_482263 [Jimgerdemannia flammicorona]
MPRDKKNKPPKDPLSLDPDSLQQGELYICKIKLVKLALFEGWNDDMCCFSLLREESTPMRWSEARYLPGEFSAFEAFDPMGNPKLSLWENMHKPRISGNWFEKFEEARRKQRVWIAGIDRDDVDLVPPPHVD